MPVENLGLSKIGQAMTFVLSDSTEGASRTRYPCDPDGWNDQRDTVVSVKILRQEPEFFRVSCLKKSQILR
jgi:hypothetical protein